MKLHWQKMIGITALILLGVTMISVADKKPELKEYRDLINESQERIIADKKISRFGNKILISDLEFSAAWFPDNHPLKDYKNLTIEFQIEDINTGKNISIKGNGLIPKYSGQHFNINTSWASLTDLPYKLDWSYSTTFTEAEKNYEEYSIKEKKYANYIKIPDLSKTAVLNDFKGAYLDPGVAACGSISSQGSYSLNTTVNSSGTCMTITASNVGFSCGGYTINYSWGSSGYGVYVPSNGYNNITVQSCTIKQGVPTTSTSYGIYAMNSKLDRFTSNTITTTGANSHGIYLYIGSDSSISTSNTITTSGSSAHGIASFGSTNITVTGGTINVYGSSGNGIYLSSSGGYLPSNTLVYKTSIKTNSSLAYAVYNGYLANISIINSTLNSSYAGVGEFYVGSGVTGGIWNITNTTENGNGILVNWTSGAVGTLNMMWYLDVRANYTYNGTGIANVNISAWNVNNNFLFSEKTDARGNITRKIFQEYMRNSTTTIYYSNYSINASYNGFDIQKQYINLSTSTSIGFSFFTPNITGCGGMLNLDNQQYLLKQHVTTAVTCFNITANNVTLDMNGFNASGDSGATDYGVYSTLYNSSTIKNGFINKFGLGVYFITSHNNTIDNMTIKTNGYGIEILTSNNNRVSNIRINSSTTYGILLYTSSNNTIENITSVLDSVAFYLRTTAKDNQITNIDIQNCTSTTVGCIRLSGSSNNTISKGTINNSKSNLFYLDSNANNNTFQDLNLLEAVKNATFLTSTSRDNIFLNVTYNITNESVATGSSLIRKWYYRAYVNDTEGNDISGAYVSAVNVTGSLQFNMSTNGSGWTNITEIIEYVNNGGNINGGNRSYYNDYTINATNTSSAIGHTYNVSIYLNNLMDVFTLYAVGGIPTGLCSTINCIIDCSTNPTLSSPEDLSENLTLSNIGIFTINSYFNWIGTTQYIFHNSGCEVQVNSGGNFP